MTPFVKRVEEYAAYGSVVQILCQRPTTYTEYRKALSVATVNELETALKILKEFPKINGASRKRIEDRLTNIKEQNSGNSWRVEYENCEI